MYFHEALIRWGVPTMIKTISTNIPTTATQKIPIGQKMPEDIGRIYGMSVTVTGFDSDNTALITNANSIALYLQIKVGSTLQIDTIRLDSLVFNNASGTYQGDMRYLPFNISDAISLDQSNYLNPTGIVAGRILLNLWFITPDKYRSLIKNGYVKDTAYSTGSIQK